MTVRAMLIIFFVAAGLAGAAAVRLAGGVTDLFGLIAGLG